MIAAQLAVSGTREPLPEEQQRSLREVLFDLVVEGTWELHHSDEHGAAEYAHWVWTALRQPTVSHPSTTNTGRAMMRSTGVRPRLPTAERDTALAAECQALVHAPDETDHGIHQACRARAIPVIVVLPSGNVEQWSGGLYSRPE